MEQKCLFCTELFPDNNTNMQMHLIVKQLLIKHNLIF